MNNTIPHSRSESMANSNFGYPPRQTRTTVSWGAIFAGAMAGLALYVLFMLLATGLGLAIYSPLTENNPVSNLSIGALIIHSIGAIVALWCGGWVAGYFTSASNRSTAWLHGFSVWGAATIGGILLVILSVGLMLGGIASLAGSGLSAVADLGKEAIEQSGETITSFVDEAVSSLSEDASEHEGIRAKREIGFALARLFNPVKDGNTAANRADAVTALVNHTGMSQVEADRAVTEWTDSYERLQDDLAEVKADAADKAREVADSAASALAKFSLWAFIGLLIGALAATGGGHIGAKCAVRCENSNDMKPYAPVHDE